MAHLNAQLLTKVQQHLLSNPGAFNIEDFDTDVAGLAVAAAGIDPATIDAYTVARRLLHLTKPQLDALCFIDRWPRRFRARFQPEPTSTRQVRSNALLAASRIAFFVAVGR